MARLIDADELRERFLERAKRAEDDSMPMTAAEMMLVARDIDRAPTVGGWTSVKDRLPEREGLYLCWSAINGGEACYQIHLWKDGRWYWVHDVRYWMPLPEPPEERKTEEEDKTGWFSDESPTPAP